MNSVIEMDGIHEIRRLKKHFPKNQQKFLSSILGAALICFPFLLWGSFIHVLNKTCQQVSGLKKPFYAQLFPSEGQQIKNSVEGMLSSEKSLVAAPHYTHAIGTISHPTFDGGIINATEGIPVNSPPDEVYEEKTSDKTDRISQKTITEQKPDMSKNDDKEINHVKKFSDRWATSSHLDSVLQHAIQTGQLGYVLSETRDQHLPESLALIPVVESAYCNTAVSPKGAVGSWQLMASTALENGINPTLRTEFVPATRAALRFLNQLYRHFGNWELVFAAYNAGSATVDKAIQKNPQAMTLQELDLPEETKNYVNKLMSINEALMKKNWVNVDDKEEGML